MESNQKIHIVQKNGGCYDESYHYIIGVWLTFDEALEQAKSVCKMHDVDEDKLPMSFDEYINCNSGYPDDPYVGDIGHEYTKEEDDFYNTRINRDGHTIDEFEIMDRAFSVIMDDFLSCSIETCLIGNIEEDVKVKQSTTYVSNDKEHKGKFIIRTY